MGILEKDLLKGYRRQKKYDYKKVIKLIKQIKFIDLLNFNNLNILPKLFTMVFLTSLLPIVTFSGLSIINSSNEIERAIYESNALYTTLTKERMNEYFHTREGEAKILADSRIISEGIDKINSFNINNEETNKIMNDFTKLLSIPIEEYGYTDIFLTNKYGEVVFSVNYNKLDLAPLVVSGEFNNKAMNGEQNWSGIFRNSFIDDNIMVLSTPIYGYTNQDHQNSTGTINIVLNQDAISFLVQSGIEKLGISGDAYLIDEKGLLLTNTLKEPYNVGAALVESIKSNNVEILSESIQNKDINFTQTLSYISYAGKEVIGTVSVTEIGSHLAGLIIEVEKDESLKEIKQFKKELTIIAIIILVIAIILATFIALSISQPIVRATKLSGQLAEYDLKIPLEVEQVNRKDELGNLQRSIVKIAKSLKNIINEVDYSAKEVVNDSRALSISAEHSSSASDEIVKEISEISKGSLEQVSSSENSFGKTKALNEVIKKDYKNLEEMTMATNEVSDLVGSGLEVIQIFTNINQKTNQTNKELHNNILKSHNSFKKIEKASQLIMDIANRTNLLSFNASIEAARSGEYGSGFTVVANEMRSLAEQSKEYSKTINNIIDELHGDTIVVEDSIRELMSISEKQMEIVDTTRNKYLEIAEAINGTESKVQILHQSRALINKMVQEVEEGIRILVVISEHNAASTQNVSASLEEQNAMLEEISIASKDLDVLSNNLKKLVNIFKV